MKLLLQNWQKGKFKMDMFDLNWYHSLTRPKISPPDWVFAPAWSILYMMIFISLIFFVKDGDFDKKIVPFAIFSLQLMLNVIWTPICFGAKRILLALFVIVALWFSIIAVIYTFYQHSKFSAILLIPYFLWVSYATYLNYKIWWLNR